MAYGYSYGPPGEHQKAKEAEASSMDGEPRGYFCACLDNHAIIGDGDDEEWWWWWWWWWWYLMCREENIAICCSGCCWCTGLSLEQQMTRWVRNNSIFSFVMRKIFTNICTTVIFTLTMIRYVLFMGATFAAFLGPFSGVLMAAAVCMSFGISTYLDVILTIVIIIFNMIIYILR